MRLRRLPTPTTPSATRRKRTCTHSMALAYAARRRRLINNNDWISNLPDDLLQNILSKLSTKEAIKTSILSKRWKGLWRWRPDLVLDMNHVDGNLCVNHVPEVSVFWSESITKVMNNHQGNLESCTLHHYPYQSEDGTLERWIQSVTRVKHTQDLTLVNHPCCLRPNGGYSVLHIHPYSFSYNTLTTVSLYQFMIISDIYHGFYSCSNLKTLKLINIVAEVRVINGILAACSSLEKLLLVINHVERIGVLKIENKNLKYLQMSTPEDVDGIEVIASGLDVLDMNNVWCGRNNFILKAPNVLFNRDHWLALGSSHIRCNISHLAQRGDKSNWHELTLTSPYEARQFGSLSVSVDMTNPNEIDILKDLLLIWSTATMIELEIVFKNNNATREDQDASSINRRGRKQFWKDRKPFPNAEFRVDNVWLYNFSSSNRNEFALASRLVRQRTVTTKMMIETSSFPQMKKLETEIAVVKLKARSNGRLRIQCF